MARIGMLVVAGLAGVANAQTMTLFWEFATDGGDVGNVSFGDTARLSLWVSMDPGATGFAGSIYDVVGLENLDLGTVVAHDNLLDALTDDGSLQPNGDVTGIESFQLPPFFNSEFNAGNPIKIFELGWTPNDFSFYRVTVGDVNHINCDVYTDDFGSSRGYACVEGTVSFWVNVPAPGGLATMGAGLLAAARRRR